MQKSTSKLISIILASSIITSICAIPITASAETEYAIVSEVEQLEETDVSAFRYSISNGEATILELKDNTLTQIKIPSEIDGCKVTCIGEVAFSGCSITNIEIPDTVKTIYDGAFSYCYSLKDVKIPDSVTTIGNFAFGYCAGFTKIEVPDSVTYLGASTFLGCYNATEVKLSENIDTLGDNLFKDCSKLKSIKIPDKVKEIRGYVFSGCASLENVEIPDSVTTIGENAFEYCRSIKSIKLPGNITSISNCLFEYCEALENVDIPNNVTSLGLGAFLGCSALKSIKIHNNMTSIGDYSFSSCSSLENVEIPNSVTYLGKRAFQRCYSLTSVTLPESIDKVSDYLFYECPQLTRVKLPNTITKIGEYAFAYCGSYTMFYIDLPSTVQSIGEGAFSNSSIVSIKIPDGIKRIEPYTFNKCPILVEIQIPSSVESIGAFAFYLNSNSIYKFSDIYYTGAQEDWNAITIDNNNPDLGNATIYYEQSLADSSDFEYIISDSNYYLEPSHATIINLKDKNFSGSLNIPAVIDGAIVNSANFSSFSLTNHITSINIPATFFSNAIEQNAVILPMMYLENINISKGNLYASSYNGIMYNKDRTALIDCPVGKAGKVEIPYGVKEIKASSFGVCSRITEINIPNSVTTIESYGISCCDSLKTLNLPASINSIQDNAIGFCKNLEEINVDENNAVYSSENGVLFNKDKTELILLPEKNSDNYVIPDGVLRINENAFSFSSRKKGITVPRSVVEINNSIGRYSFSTMYVYENSYAHKYAVEKNINYELIKEPVLGDVNGDDVLSLQDAILIQKHLLQVSKLSDEEVSAGDINGDGQLTVADIVVIMRTLLK